MKFDVPNSLKIVIFESDAIDLQIYYKISIYTTRNSDKTPRPPIATAFFLISLPLFKSQTTLHRWSTGSHIDGERQSLQRIWRLYRWRANTGLWLRELRSAVAVGQKRRFVQQVNTVIFVCYLALSIVIFLLRWHKCLWPVLRNIRGIGVIINCLKFRVCVYYVAVFKCFFFFRLSVPWLVRFANKYFVPYFDFLSSQ